MSYEISPLNAPDLAAGVGMLAVAALLLYVAPRSRVHRAFALFQVLRGTTSIAYASSLAYLRSDPPLNETWIAFQAYLELATPFAAIFFAARFLDPAGRSRLARVFAWASLVGAIVTLGAFALDHSLYYQLDEGGATIGPLYSVQRAALPLEGALALLLVLRAGRASDDAQRSGQLLAAIAFAGVPSFWGGLVIGEIVFVGVATSSAALVGGLAAGAGLLAVLAAAAVALALPPLWGDVASRPLRTALLATALAALVSGVVAERVFESDPLRFTAVPSAIDGVWRVVATLVIAYALLRKRVFDEDARLRFAIGRSTIAATFIAVFFLASEGAQMFFGRSNQVVGLVAAGALVFAMSPLQRAADRLAERAVPSAGPGPIPVPAASPGREQAYRAALRAAVRDKVLTREEEIGLAHLSDELGLTHKRAREIWHEVSAEIAGGVRQ